VLNNKYSYLAYYLKFKKQNSILKKKYNFVNIVNPVYFKSGNNSKNKINNLFIKNSNGSTKYSVVNGKKKLKKIILKNRLYYSFLHNYIFKNSKKLSNNIDFTKKNSINNILLNFQYSIINLIQSLNLFKTFLDIKQLFNNKIVYVNRKQILNTKKSMQIGDVIEFNISFKLYCYLNKAKHGLNKQISKLKNKLWFKVKGNYNRKLDINTDFQVNKLIGKTNNYLSILNYLEVDYFSLTCILIFKNLNLLNVSLKIKKILVVYLFKLYN
jgi:hypothetical protein